MNKTPSAINGARPVERFVDPAATADDIAARFSKFVDTGADVDDGFVDDTGEDDVPVPVTSINDQHFAVDPRPPLTAYLCKPKTSRQLWLAARDVERADIHRYGVYLAKTLAGKLYLLCVRRPSISGSDFPSWAAMRRIARRAQQAGGWWATQWREQPDGTFKLRGGPCPDLAEPVTFPSTALEELLLLAFEDRVVEAADDPRLPKLPDLSDAPDLA